jgi:hypothetical protein
LSAVLCSGVLYNFADRDVEFVPDPPTISGLDE